MIDPFVSLFMSQEEQASCTHNDASNHITVEEAIDCRNSNSRFFNLLNKQSQLSIIINDNSTLMSCELAGHEIVVDRNLYQESHETWAIGERPFQKLSCVPWTSHVRGSELILSSSTNSAPSNNNPHTSLHFELTQSNELLCVAKLKTIHLQHQVFYYNLNRALDERTPLDGHTIVVRCNGNLNRILVQPTKLLCQCNKTSTILPYSLIGDIPLALRQHPENPNSDDLILCDAIYSLESYTGSPDYLQAQLQYRNRVLVFEVRSARSVLGQTHNLVGGGVSSSSKMCAGGALSHLLLDDLNPSQTYAFSSLRMDVSGSGASRDVCDEAVASSSSGQHQAQIPRVKLEPLDPTPPCNRQSSDVSNSHAATVLRLRVRVTNFGVSILPIMMTNYATSLSFNVI